jgi:hypothetical protein
MVSDCFLHIGTEKTGTTSIQTFLAKNRDELLRQGVLYPASPGSVNHLRLATFCLDDAKADETRLRWGLNRDEPISEFRERLLQVLDDEIGASITSTLVFSNEHLSSRLTNSTEIGRVRDVCARYAKRTTVLVYLRNQTDFLVSSYNMSIVAGGVGAFPYPLTQRHIRRMDYAALLKPWIEVFGADNIVVRRFEAAAFAKNDLLSDFALQLGLDEAELVRPDRVNEALDARSLAFLREFNKRLPKIAEDRLNPLRGQIVKALRNGIAGPKLSVPPDIAAAVEQCFDESNRQVSEIFFEGRTPLFAAPVCVGTPSVESQLSLTVEDAMDIAARLWAEQQKKLRRLQKATN